MLENLSEYNIVLASGSPRRKELLSGLGINFSTENSIRVEERYPSTLWKEEIPVFLARKKAEAYRTLIGEKTMLITADTIVWLNGEVFGKPKNREEAKSMLELFSGKTHEVITGVGITTKVKQKLFYAVSKVKFSRLDEKEIEYYLRKYNPMDKAGAYGIQEWIGYIGVREIEGSFYNIMGLPVKLLYDYLKNWNIKD